MQIANGLSEAMDAAFPTGDEGSELNLKPYDAWLAETLNAAYADNISRASRTLLDGLRGSTLKAFPLKFGKGVGAVLMLADWMRAREAVESLPNNDPVVDRSDALDALYDLAALIESMEEQEDWPYLKNLRDEIAQTIDRWSRDFDWFLKDDFDVEDVFEEVDFAYDTRDDLEWALDCLDFFKLEFPGRLVDFDVDRYRRQLKAPDEVFRKVIAKAKKDGWHQPDPDAPKSFWWRKP